MPLSELDHFRIILMRLQTLPKRIQNKKETLGPKYGYLISEIN